jgi:hypothetical protein
LVMKNTGESDCLLIEDLLQLFVAGQRAGQRGSQVPTP